MFIWLLLFWILPMYVAYKLAGKKNRTQGGWLVMTMFFGWIAVIILGVLEKRKPETVN